MPHRNPPQVAPGRAPVVAPQLRVRLWIDLGTTTLLGPGRVALLEAIAAQGSISAAGRALGMSYRKAWTLVRAINEVAPVPLVERVTGGAGGGGARLTGPGQSLVTAFRRHERELLARGRQAERDLARLLARAVDAARPPTARRPAGGARPGRRA